MKMSTISFCRLLSVSVRPLPPKSQFRSRTGGVRQRVVKNLILLGGSSGASALLSMLSTATNSRALNLTDFGTFILLQTSALLVAGIFSFATQQPIIKLGVRALEAGETEKFESFVGLGLLVDTASAVVATIVSLVLVSTLPALIGISAERISPAILVAASLLFQGYRTSEGIFRAFDRFDLIGFIQILSAAIQFLFALILWWYDAAFILYAVLAALVISLSSCLQLITALFLLRSNGMWPRLRYISAKSSERSEFMTYCWSTSVMGTCDTIRGFGDSPLVGALVSVEAVGIYNVAKQLAGILRKGTAIYASVLFPELASMAAAGRFLEAKRTLHKAVAVSLAITVVAVIGSVLVGSPVLTLVFGPRFAAGSTVLTLLTLAAGLQLVSASYSMLVQAFIGPIPLLYAYFLAASSFLLVAFIGLSNLGVWAMGLAQIAFVIALTAGCGLKLMRYTAQERLL